jgi:hypothetical protein
MKKIKVIYLVGAFTAGLLWSCQTEAYVESASKSKVVADGGLPSPLTDPYQFDKTQYYYGSQLVSDTLKIKNLMAQAKAIHIDENGKTYIYVTDAETKAFEAEMTKSENDSKNDQSAEGRAAVSGDKYIHYFFESGLYPRNQRKAYFEYTQLNGQVLNYPGSYLTFNDYYAENGGTPRFTGTTRGSLDHYAVFNRNLSTANFFYEINVLNTTRYKRRLVFVSKDLIGGIKKVYKDFSRGKSYTFYGQYNIDSAGGVKFNGVSHFWIDKHNSWKI